MKLPPASLDSTKRIAIMVLLERYNCLNFSDLVRSLSMSKGAVASHLKTLVEKELIYRESRFDNGPKLFICITPEGVSAIRAARLILGDLLDE